MGGGGCWGQEDAHDEHCEYSTNMGEGRERIDIGTRTRELREEGQHRLLPNGSYHIHPNPRIAN